MSNAMALRDHLTGLLKAINPEITHIDYVCDYGIRGALPMLRMARMTYANGQTRAVEMDASADIRSNVITLVACCVQKSGGGKRHG